MFYCIFELMYAIFKNRLAQMIILDLIMKLEVFSTVKIIFFVDIRDSGGICIVSFKESTEVFLFVFFSSIN